jgi:hypothetical protein
MWSACTATSGMINRAEAPLGLASNKWNSYLLWDVASFMGFLHGGFVVYFSCGWAC